MGLFDVFGAVAAASPKPDADVQDRAVVVEARALPPGTGVIVCDGVGAYKDSGIVAGKFAAYAARFLETNGMRDGLWNVCGAITSSVPAVASATDTGSGATTFLALGADVTGHVGYCLIGNGMLVEIEAQETGLGAVRLRWADVALPQVSLAAGRPALRSFLPFPEGLPVERTVGARLVNGARPRMFLACTDGIATDEDRTTGTTSDGAVWQEVPLALAMLLRALSTSWLEVIASPTELLASTLQGCLDALLAANALDDDATVGALLLRPAPPVGAEVSK